MTPTPIRSSIFPVATGRSRSPSSDRGRPKGLDRGKYAIPAKGPQGDDPVILFPIRAPRFDRIPRSRESAGLGSAGPECPAGPVPPKNRSARRMLIPAKTTKLIRHPIAWTTSTRGVAAVMFPRVPKESTRADRVANLSGGNHRVISLRVPIRLQAIPAPRSILPATRLRSNLRWQKPMPRPPPERQRGHGHPRPDGVEVHADGDLYEGKGIEKSGGNQAEPAGVHPELTDQVGRYHRYRGPVKLGEEEQEGCREEDDPAAAQ